MNKVDAKQKSKKADGNQSIPQMTGHTVIKVGDIRIPFGSSNPEDYVDALNKVANKIGSFDFLGTFSDIESVECSNALKVETSSSFVHIEVENCEQSDQLLINDGSSINPLDYSIKQLLSK